MANTKIRGITIEIGGDTSSLDKSLKTVNKQIKETQSQLKDVEKLLKLDPGNTELLAQKQRLLNEAVAETNKKLDTLKEAEKSVQKQFEEGTVSQEQYDALKREIISVELELENATKKAANFSAEAEKMAASMDAVSSKAQTVADKTKAISAAGAAVVGSLGAMAYKAAQTADELNTLSSQTGFSTEEIQKFQYASEMVDVSFDSITQATRQMTAKLKENEAAFTSLGVQTRDARGNLKDTNTIFYETLAALGNIQNGTQRDVEAIKVFGESASNLTGIIDDGGAALKAYGDQAEATGKIWSQESIDAANAANNVIDTLKADVSQTILVTGAKALEALKPVIDTVVTAIGNLLEKIGSLSEGQIKTIAVIATVVASISPIAGIIAKITSAAGTLIRLLPTITPILSAMASPWTLVAAAAVAAVTLIIKNWDKIKKFFTDLINWFKTNVVKPVTDLFTKIKDTIVGFWNKIVDTAKSKINNIIELINTAIQKINKFSEAVNSSKVGEALGIELGTIPEIPKLASGGVLTSGTALVGEAGPELLTVNSGRAIVQPLSGSGTTGAAMTNVYNFNVDNIATYQKIEAKLQNERRSQRMGYVGV